MSKAQFTVTFACALAVLAAPAVARAEIVVGAADNRPESSPEQAERFYDTMSRVGLKENRLAIIWNPQQPTQIDRRDALDQAVTARGSPGHPAHVLGLRAAGERDLEQSRERRAFRRVPCAARPDLSDGSRLHRRQRAEQAARLAAAVHRQESRRLLLLCGHPRRLLRRSQGGRPADHRHRPRDRRTRQRQPRVGHERVDLSGAVHPGRGPRLPREQAHASVDGRDQHPPVPAERL